MQDPSSIHGMIADFRRVQGFGPWAVGQQKWLAEKVPRRVIWLAPRANLSQSWTGHRCTLTLKNWDCSRPTYSFSVLMLLLCTTFTASSPGTTRGSRKFVFDKFWLDKGCHEWRIFMIQGEIFKNQKFAENWRLLAQNDFQKFKIGLLMQTRDHKLTHDS